MPHLYVFSVRTLERLLAQHGFQVIAAGNVPRGICVLAKPGETIALEHRDDPEAIHSLIDSYKRRHDRDTFLYRYIANSIPAKILIKSRLPWISRALAQFRERVRVNKII
ncbi:hypothetical protein HZA85_02370 [Candidatus Uhrbacteria bacterium]|nr:hypothetical protein [Candidatus Uhrbacteria bacterium]